MIINNNKQRKPSTAQTHKYFIKVFILFALTVCIIVPEVWSQVVEPEKSFSFWTVGNSARGRFGDWYPMYSELEKNEELLFCLLNELAGKQATIDEILTSCEFERTLLNNAIDSLLKHNFIGRLDDGALYSKIPVMTHGEMKLLQSSLKPIAERVAKCIDQEIISTVEVYNRSKQISDPEWEDISHLVIDKFIIDASFHHGMTTLEKENGYKKYYSDEQKDIPAFFLQNGSIYGTFGVNWYGIKGSEQERHVYVLHGAPFKRFDIPFNKYGRSENFADIFHRISNDGGLERLNNDEIKIFSDLGWVKHNTLTIPFIQAESIRIIKDQVEKIGIKASKLVFEDFSVIMNCYEDSAHSNYSSGAGDYLQVCYHLLFSSIIEELIELGTLPAIPEPVPEDIGVYVTIGSFFD